MSTASLLKIQALSLGQKIKVYRKRAKEIEEYLNRHPHEWGRFQSEFNQEINGIFRELMIFEKEHLASDEEGKVYKLKQLFVKRFRQDFVIGEYLKWSLEKPLGYAGDYKIIDDIYQNNPTSQGFVRLFDNYFQMSAICVAVRNRKEDFKKIISEVIQDRKGKPVKIMDLASGPCRDIYEIISHPSFVNQDVTFHCLDADEKSFEYAKKLIRDDKRVKFIQRNVVRLALKKDILSEMEGNYDLIFSTGLFDYLDYRISLKLVSNLKKLLNKESVLAISDVRNKFSNPSIYFMEWVADWSLIYRDDDNFRQIFIDAGFVDGDLTCRYEQQGIMQYAIASQRN